MAQLNVFGDPIVGASGQALNAFGDPILGAPPAFSVPTPQRVQDISDAVMSGWQNSATGLALRGKLPELQLDKDAPIGQRLAAGASNILSDFIPSAIGAYAGMAVGGVAGPKGAAVGGAAGGFAVPMGIRDALMAAYNRGEATSWGGVWDIVKAGATGFGKGATIGAVTGGAGMAVGKLVAPAAGSAVLAGNLSARGARRAVDATAIGSELTALTAASAALEGHMPTWQDFMDNAILLGGLKGAVHVAGKMREAYAQTGKLPDEVRADAARDPALMDELLTRGETVVRSVSSETKNSQLGADVFVQEPVRAEFTTDKGLDISLVRDFRGKYNILVGDEKIGAITYTSQPSGGFRIGGVEVAPEYQRRGVATAAYDFIEQQVIKQPLEAGGGQSAAGAAFREARTSRGILPKEYELPGAYKLLAQEERVKAAVDFAKPEELVEAIRKHQENPDATLGKEPVAYDYITDKATAEGVVAHIAEVWRAENEAHKRGAVPVAKSVEEGVALLKANELGEHKIGEAGNSGEIYARALLTKGAAERAQQLAADLAKLTKDQWSVEARLKLAAAIEQTNLFYQEFKGVSAEVGRALNMLGQIKRNPNLLGNAESMLALYEKNIPMEQVAYLMSRIKDVEGMKLFASEFSKATTTEKILEAWKAAILSGPQTHLANIAGNTTKWLLDIPESALSATIFAAGKALKGDPITVAQWKARAFAPVYGVTLGLRDAFTVATEVAVGRGEHLEKADVYRHAIEGTKGEIIRLPFRALQVQDAFFRTFGERGQAYIMAIDRATNEKLLQGSREFNEAVIRYTQDPTLGLNAAAAAKITEQIQTAGAQAVFSQRLGKRMEMAQQAMAGHWSQFFIPFVRTPANLISWSVQHLPVANLMSARWRADFAAGGEARAQALSRVTVGATLAITAYTLAEDGILTGGGMFDKEQRRAKAAAGWQPYSILIDGKWYSYQRIEPVAKVLGLAADLIELQKVSADKGDKAKIGAMMALMFGNATISTTYLSGLSNTMNALSDPDRYGGNLVEQYASSLVPKLIGQTAAAVDPYKREVDGALDAIQSQIPFLREKMLPKRDAWGEPTKNDKWFSVLPVATSEASQDKVRTEAARLQLAIADAPRFVAESSPLQRKDEQVKLTEKQRDIFRETGGKFAMEILSPLVNHPDWAQIPDFVQANMYKDVLERSRKLAEIKASPPDDPARMKIRQDLINKMTKQTNEAETRASSGKRIQYVP